MKQKSPQHIAIIMDGNGRWAEQRGLARIEGHKAGVEAAKNIMHSCIKRSIPCLSLFAFSSENWARPSEEVDFLMSLFIDVLEQAQLHSLGIKICFTGDRGRLNSMLQAKMNEEEKLTENNCKLTLNIVLNYGGKWDIVNATKNIAQAVLNGQLDVQQIDESLFSSYLATRGLVEPDLFIRTSGELRISNFFLWQLAYTELYFTRALWPDFSEEEFEKALQAFSQRNRRFGQLQGEVI